MSVSSIPVVASALAAVAVVVAVGATRPDAAPETSVTAPAPAESAPAARATETPTSRTWRLAQTYSSKCVTPTTICFVDPAPLGNPCSCGSSQGRIQR